MLYGARGRAVPRRLEVIWRTEADIGKRLRLQSVRVAFAKAWRRNRTTETCRRCRRIGRAAACSSHQQAHEQSFPIELAIQDQTSR